jgi:hypothetical protein
MSNILRSRQEKYWQMENFFRNFKKESTLLIRFFLHFTVC